jgi:hypothetical protein
MTRTIIFSTLLAALACVTIWFALRSGDFDKPASVSRSARPASVEARLARIPALPESHQPAIVRTKLDGFAQWLATTFPQAKAEFLGADCVAAPCLIGVRFSAKGLSSPADVRAVLAGVRGEIERRVGIRMSVVHSDEDSEGRDYLWMYGLPDELAVEHRETLRESAEQRYSLRMDPLRLPIEPHVPQSSEPGYTGG